MADQGLLRTVRVAVFTLVCVLLAASGHGMAAGHLPPPALLAVGGMAVAATVGRFACRERTLAEIGGAVTLAQGALHLLFAFAGPALPVPPSHRGHAGNGEHTGIQTSLVTGDSPAPWGGAEEPLGALMAHSDPSMLLAHLVAGLGAAWWLRRGEALVWRLGRLLGARVSATLRAVALLRWWLQGESRLPCRRLPVIAGVERVSDRARVLEHSLARRGPPAVFTR
ncbi:hypothetical protein AB0M39_12030 [Streptomyces sp. NPDC051907]|uniref:hypothetical protein n=1 Tax=Streptomyces sp. NPDC051907 TaxID=3155284 RepID=UPI0034160D92